ncbi:hypothetical protein OIV83_000649 [Microbotryomycetes sp. JL201]|nr:hypothetical protein OIV83_000649 [Microbotryomycetes sp. JL201]
MAQQSIPGEPEADSPLDPPSHDFVPSFSLVRTHLVVPRRFNARATTYTSLPCEPPKTPGDEDEERRGNGSTWARWLWHSQDRPDIERGEATVPQPEHEPLLRKTSQQVNHEGLPKVTRQCLVAEIKCYGKYMLPPIIVFVVIALSVAMLVYGKAIHATSEEREENAPFVPTR